MGADFKEKAKRTFEKCWDKAAVDANTPTLFSKVLDRAPARFEAEAFPGAKVALGDSFFIRMENGKAIGRRGLSPTLTISSPPPSLVQSIGDGCNVARAEVVSTDPISGFFEVTIN